jgi:hypothetical protein
MSVNVTNGPYNESFVDDLRAARRGAEVFPPVVA